LHGPIALEFGAEVLIFKSSGIQEKRERCGPSLPAAVSRSGKREVLKPEEWQL
jgi:hypothetical protein